MSVVEGDAKSKRGNRTIILYLGKTEEAYQSEYGQAEGIAKLIQRVEEADGANWGCLANGHHEGCSRQLRDTHHSSYERGVKHFDGSRSGVTIYRVRCLDCGAVFTVLPSFVARYKRYGTDAMEKFMTMLFITEDSYRMAGVGQAFGIDTQQAGTWAALEHAEGIVISPRALWRLTQWVGQLSPAQLNLALGIEPPTHIIEDEKHVTQRGDKAYVPIVYAPNEALIWWVDYLHSVSSDALHDSLERFKALSDRLSGIRGATVDGWDPAQEALKRAFPDLTLQECLFHATLKLDVHLATYKHQRKALRQPLSAQEEEDIFQAFRKVLYAPTSQEYQDALNALLDVFNQEPLVSRKHSLRDKQALFQAWTTDARLAPPLPSTSV